jgi:hypothetical protein
MNIAALTPDVTGRISSGKADSISADLLQAELGITN